MPMAKKKLPKFIMVYGKSPDTCKIKTFHSRYPKNVVSVVKEKYGYNVYYFKRMKKGV